MRGRKARLSIVNELEGDPSKGTKRKAVRAKPGEPKRPAWLCPVAVEQWKHAVEVISGYGAGILATADMTILTLLCTAWADFVAAREWLADHAIDVTEPNMRRGVVSERNDAWKRLMKAVERLGLSPVDRERIPRGSDPGKRGGVAEFAKAKGA